MGASGSKSAVAPILPASQLSAAQVAEAVKALGGSYIPYAEKLEKDLALYDRKAEEFVEKLKAEALSKGKEVWTQ